MVVMVSGAIDTHTIPHVDRMSRVILDLFWISARLLWAIGCCYLLSGGW